MTAEQQQHYALLKLRFEDRASEFKHYSDITLKIASEMSAINSEIWKMKEEHGIKDEFDVEGEAKPTHNFKDGDRVCYTDEWIKGGKNREKWRYVRFRVVGYQYKTKGGNLRMKRIYMNDEVSPKNPYYVTVHPSIIQEMKCCGRCDGVNDLCMTDEEVMETVGIPYAECSICGRIDDSMNVSINCGHNCVGTMNVKYPKKHTNTGTLDSNPQAFK